MDKENKDFLNILEANSFTVSGGTKIGKMTFVSYMLTTLFKQKALLFTPQEKFLFKRRLTSLSKQFIQLEKINDFYTIFYTKEEWHTLKQKYGFAFFLQELEYIITSSSEEEKIIIFHRIDEYFEFQDRYEIQNVYTSLIKTAVAHNKKIIFLANNKHENYEYINNLAEEFSDVLITIDINEKNERLIDIKDILHNKEYPLIHFKINKETFLLTYYHETSQTTQNRVKNVLISELNRVHDNLKDICSYIFDKPDFNVKYADSLQSILQEIFLSPDIIIVMMKRTKENLKTIKAIKEQLPNSPIVTILDQEFVRAEDAQEAYHYGCDELFANNLPLEKLILTFQKVSKTLFYEKEIQQLQKYDNIMKSLDDMKNLAQACIDRSVFFTIFIFTTDKGTKKIQKSSRHHDYIFQSEKKLYLLALNTLPRDAKALSAKYNSYTLECIWEPINHTSVTRCLR